ncbi:hypothetical protein ACFQVD_42435 [Streptosporangium amethystogenes subsp. fukuiense]|uniref:LPXTG cell wall anchor domain-containing protein n=1 Tax=Streptosporangium amethystogenes subsp. fukuiense TaxID=698418 RepID=A0ABW2TG78_9ACTN
MRLPFGLPENGLPKSLPYKNRLATAALVGAGLLVSGGVVSALPASPAAAAPASVASPGADTEPVANGVVLLQGSTRASYFWDDSSGRAGDTGLPASGKPMQKGMIASPSWPLFTEGYVVYKGKKAKFFVGDRGPGVPSNSGVMIDLDAKTFADLTGGRFNPATLGVDGNGGMGHIDVKYVVTKWGDGVGKKNHPVAFSTGAWRYRDANPAKPPQTALVKAERSKKSVKTQQAIQTFAKPKIMSEPLTAPEAIIAAKPLALSGAAGAAEQEVRDLGATAPVAAETSTGPSTAASLALAGVLAAGGGTYLVAGRLRRRAVAEES